MEQKADNVDLSKTHTHFFFENILAATDLAFRIKVFNRKGAQTTVWVPKSRISYEDKLVNTANGVKESKRKYYAPNFFIK